MWAYQLIEILLHKAQAIHYLLIIWKSKVDTLFIYSFDRYSVHMYNNNNNKCNTMYTINILLYEKFSI